MSKHILPFWLLKLINWFITRKFESLKQKKAINNAVGEEAKQYYRDHWNEIGRDK